MGSKFKKSNSSSRPSVGSGLHQEARMYQSIDYEKLPVVKDGRVVYSGRSSRAYKTNGFSVPSDSFVDHTLTFLSHEANENFKDRRHDSDMELLKQGVVRKYDPYGIQSFDVPLGTVSPLGAIGNLFSKVTNGAGHALASLASGISSIFNNKITTESNERRHYANLKAASKRDKRNSRMSLFHFFASEHLNERSKRKAHKRQKDLIAFKRGYW